MSALGNKVRITGVLVILAILSGFAGVNPAVATGPAHGSWSATGSMSASRYLHTATLLADGTVLVTGGYTHVLSIASAEVYDPAAGTWSPTGSMTTGRYFHTATLLSDGRVLAVGGNTTSGDPASAEVYDPSTGTWSATGSMSAGRSLHTATLLPDGSVLVTGGFSSSGYLTSAEIYDPSTGTWSATGSMTTARNSHEATRLADGRVLVTGGENNGSYLASAEVYNPSTGVWSATGSMSANRNLHTATLLPDGRVLVAGSHTPSLQTLATAEVYDPAAGSWTATGPMTTGRAIHTATLLTDGRVVVAGGVSSSGYTASAEIYDSISGTWSATGSMTTTRFRQEATRLTDGRVLIMGGIDASGSGILATAEIYTISLAPQAADDAYSVDEDQLLSVAQPGVLANDIDYQNDPITAALASGPARGSLAFHPDGSFIYAPEADFNGTDSFTYTTSDGTNIGPVATVEITVEAVNDAPVVDLNGADGSGIDFAASFLPGDPPVHIGDVDLALTDVDNGATSAATGNGMIYVVQEYGGVIAIDPTTGSQTPVSDGFQLCIPRAMTIDSSTQELFIADSCGAVVKVDIATGVETTLASGGYLDSAMGIDLDPDGDLVVASESYGLVRVDRSTGSQTLVPSNGCWLGLAVEEDGDILVSNPCSDTIQKIDGVTGAQTTLASNIRYAYDIVIDASGDLFVVEQEMGGRITKIDPVSGATTLIAPGSSLTDACVVGIAADGLENLITTDYCSGIVAETEIDTGAQASLTTLPGFGPWGVAVDVRAEYELEWATLQITNLLDGADEALAADTTGTNIIASYDSGTGTLSLTGGETAENYQAVLRTVTYSNAASGPSGSHRIIEVVAFDGTETNNPAARSMILLTPLDALAPTAAPGPSPAANSAGWNNSDVTVSWNWSDESGGSGIDSASCTTSTASSGEGKLTLSGSCKDLAGNTGSASYQVRVDMTLPAVSLVGGPAAGGSYSYGAVPAAPGCSASDTLSGLDGSCTVSGYATTVGPQTVTAGATDRAGNHNSASASYTVLAWTTRGFFQPVDMGGVWNIVKGGSTVPLKFEVFAGPLELTDPAIVNQPLKATQTLCSGGPTDEIELLETGSTSLRYDTTAGQFIYNWKTPRKPGYCYVVTVTLADGTPITANFKLK